MSTQAIIEGKARKHPDNLVKVYLYGEDNMAETVWAEPLAGGLFRIGNLPFFVYGIGFEDVVEAEPTEDEGIYEFVKLRVRSGNRLIRVQFKNEEEEKPVLSYLRSIGCSLERGWSHELGINIPITVDFLEVCSYLTAAEIAWEYANPTPEELEALDWELSDVCADCQGLDH